MHARERRLADTPSRRRPRDRRRRRPQLPTDITPLTIVGPAFIAGIIAVIGYLMSVIKAASRVRASRSARPRARLFF